MFFNFGRALAILVFFATLTTSVADPNILEELRSGQHFDRPALLQAGPEVLSEALAGKPSSIALLGRYFENGERGFPKNNGVAKRLYEAAFQRGNWPTAFELGLFAEGRHDYPLAYKYYTILFLAADEHNQRYARTIKGWTPNSPGFTEMAYAKMQFLLRSKTLSEQKIAELEKAARQDAISRGLFHDCEGQSRLKCMDISDPFKQSGCRVRVEDRCYRNVPH